MVQNQLYLFGNRVTEQILHKSASYERAAQNLIKMVPITDGVLMRKTTVAHKQQNQLGWASVT